MQIMNSGRKDKRQCFKRLVEEDEMSAEEKKKYAGHLPDQKEYKGCTGQNQDFPAKAKHNTPITGQAELKKMEGPLSENLEPTKTTGDFFFLCR